MHKFFKKFQNSVIHISRKNNDDIAEVLQSWISEFIITIRLNYSESYFLQNWSRIAIWIIIDFIKMYRRIIYKTDYSGATRIHQCTQCYAPRALTDHRGPFMPPIS